MTPSEIRYRLHRGDFDPIPLNGKVPVLREWQKSSCSSAAIMSWGKRYPDASNTGILTRRAPVLDLDILDPEAADACEQLVKNRYGEASPILTRFGKAPKRAIPFKTEHPFAKITVTLIGPNGAEQRIEFLCDGQQAVVSGTHPDTLKPYYSYCVTN